MKVLILFVCLILTALTASETPWSKGSGCDDPNGFSVVEAADAEAHYVKIVRGDEVLHTIKTPTGANWNGFALDEAKKTREGFEISIEYGSRFYYHKTFIFVCRRHKFYLSKIMVDSFDKFHPQKGTERVVRVRPNLPLEKFAITDFMREGVVQHRSKQR